MTTTPAVTLPETTVAWWVHWLNVLLAAVTFVAVVIHPGWTPPAAAVTAVAVAAPALAIGSGLVLAVLHHHAGISNLTAARAYVDANLGRLENAASALYPLIDHVPAIETRLTALEAAKLPDPVLTFLAELTKTPSAAPGAPAAPDVPAGPSAPLLAPQGG